MDSNEKLTLIQRISRFLLISLLLLIALLVLLAKQPWKQVPTSQADPEMLYIVLGLGALGAFVSLQRRLKSLGDDDLRLLSESWLHAWLSPLVGGVLAAVLYCLFLSGLLGGEVFPNLCATPNGKLTEDARSGGFALIFNCAADNPRDYAKLMFWCFLAGFSEKFVVDIIGHFETQGSARNTAGAPTPPGDQDKMNGKPAQPEPIPSPNIP